MRQENILFLSLDTPALLVDMDKMEANIREMANLAADAGIKLRPPTKAHECVDIAKLQVEAGACGVAVANLAKAECMAEGGIEDILVLHPVYGDHKLEAIKRLLNRPGLKLTLVVDMIEQAEAISHTAQAAGREVRVFLKIDVGNGRFGCLPGEPALNLARKLVQLPGVKFGGIMTHDSARGERTREGINRRVFEIASVMATTARLLRENAIPVEDVCVGASATVRATCRYAKSIPEITETHPGGYVFGSRMEGTQPAVSVLTTVISIPAPNRAVIDAGTKTLSADPLIHHMWKPDYFWEGKPSYGSVKGRPDLQLRRLSVENGVIYLTDVSKKVSLGERLEIIPNNFTLATNLHDNIYGVRNGVVERAIAITCRGKGN